MTEETAKLRFPHVLSATIACAIPIAIFCAGKVLAVHIEEKTIYSTAPKDFFLKNQGLALQRAAARAPNILLLYGSSELTVDPAPNRAPEFFSNAPTGFEVCPVGKPGSMPLTMVQKVAALGSSLRDRKVAVSIAPSFFLRHEAKSDTYAGNFSLPAASVTIFGTALDFELKREIAKRMQQFPDTLAKSALLKVAVNRVASGRPLDRMIFLSIWPLGILQNFIFDLQDHFGVLAYIAAGEKRLPRRELRKIFKPFESEADDGGQGVRMKGAGTPAQLDEADFQDRIAGSLGWVDLELLFRALKEVNAQPLVLSMPLNGSFYDAHGISRSARQLYYDKLRDLAQRYGIEIEQFEDHDADPLFQTPRWEHPTIKGWTYYDRALDEFFHSSK
jgi:D-alanine transfer protein